ncbi:MAG: AAA family ATPase [Nitrososphaerales archaeon]|nr:AAA family ATPase [Nitrososphaerales archaeon]
MTFTIAVSGKGGTGKTAITALLVKALGKRVDGPMLVVDADPNSNLNEALGIDAKRTIGDIRERFLKNKESLPPEQPKDEYLNYLIQSSIIEGEDFDMMIMGRPEGPGCYCYLNNILRKIIDSTSQHYPLVLIDTEAGLEHFSRRTTKDLDLLLVVTDPTVRGAMTAKRIKELCKELHIKVGRIFLIINRMSPQLEGRIDGIAKTSGIELGGIVPEDSLIQQFDIKGDSLLNLPENSPALKAIDDLVERVLLRLIAA